MVNNTTTIQVLINGVWKSLDLFPDTSQSVIALTFQIADITDIGTRNSSYSKTVTIPDSRNNRECFEYISELTVDSLFNQNLKCQSQILVDGVPVFKGNLQLKQVNMDYRTGDCIYEVVIYNDNDTFIKNVGEKFLSDLDMSFLSHTWSYSNIVNSWFNDSNLGYYYPLLDYGSNWFENDVWTHPPINPEGVAPFIVGTTSGISVDEMYPAVYARTIFDKIVSDAGFTYKSDFIKGEYFNKIVIPYNNSEILVQGDEVYDYNFRVEYDTTPGYATSSVIVSGSNYKLPFYNEVFDPQNVFIGGTTQSYKQPTSPRFACGFGTELIYKLPVATNVVPHTGTNSFYFKLSGTYSSCLYNGQFFTKINRNFNIPGFYANVPINGGSFSNAYVNNYNGTKILDYVIYETGITNVYYPAIYTGVWYGCNYEFLWEPTGNAGVYNISLSFSCVVETDVLDGRLESGQNPMKYVPPLAGELFDLEWSFRYNDFVVSSWNNPSNPLFCNSFATVQINSDTSFYNVISSDIIPGGIMNMTSWMPKKFKQKDFIKGLLTMFNLIVDIDETDPKCLIIEPWNDYYSGNEVDWTEKIDLESIQTNFISDFQAKKTTLTYKSDGDYTNKQYLESTTEIYGEQVYEFENDFITDEKKLETSFSPTPLISLNNSPNTEGRFPISRIAQNVTGGKFGANLRILFKNLKPLEGNRPFWSLWRTYEEGAYPSDWYEIPYAGHLDDPYTPTEDLNFGQVYTSSFSWDATKNTLYNKYWKDYLEIINNPNTRILTANFILDPTDIANFRFSNVVLINLNGSINRFIVNKIIDYNPASIGTTKVELIKL